MKLLSAFLIAVSLVSTASADELRTAYLQLKELELKELESAAYTEFAMLWKAPTKGGAALNVKPVFPPFCKILNERRVQNGSASFNLHGVIRCEKDLIGQPIAIEGIHNINSDIVVHIERLNGNTQQLILSREQPAFTVTAQTGLLSIAYDYLLLGIEHILKGLDHLLFVAALLLIVGNLRHLLVTITAFTLAHSITLAGATMNWFQVAQQPVEALIAISIVMLCREILLDQKTTATYRWPWLIAFIFGLLHGFGFAGALSEIGLPQNAVPLALLFFNLGVEVGQIIFVIALTLLLWIVRTQLRYVYPATEKFVAYGIGSIATLWAVERIIGFY